MMAVESFNETSLTNGPVPQTGTKGSAMPSIPPKAVGMPSAVRKAEGTDSPRTTVTTKMAAPNSTPTGGRKGWPGGVTSYKDTL